MSPTWPNHDAAVRGPSESFELERDMAEIHHVKANEGWKGGGVYISYSVSPSFRSFGGSARAPTGVDTYDTPTCYSCFVDCYEVWSEDIDQGRQERDGVICLFVRSVSLCGCLSRGRGTRKLG